MAVRDEPRTTALQPRLPAARGKGQGFLVSACLAGLNCKHNGKNNLLRSIKRLVDNGDAITVCPEVEGGLSTPRECAQVVGGDGGDVLEGKAKVITISGKDVSKNFVTGAKVALKVIKRYNIKKAILKSNSPSCGFGRIYDGAFVNVLKRGDGVLAALLRKNGVKIYTEETMPLWPARYITSR